MNETQGLISTLLGLPVFHAEWVLWLLLLLSVLSVGVTLERALFYRRRRIDVRAIQRELEALLARGDMRAAASYLERFDSLETNATLYGLRAHACGPDAVEDLISGATRAERGRYSARLNVLATIASNAPFIGLFGTVLGIIHAFKDLAGNLADASQAVMAGIAEALVATAVGLLVAIPAVVAFNIFRGRLGRLCDDAHLLASTLLANLKSEVVDAPAGGE